MNKIGLIIGREYLTRVRKKTFIIMTLIGPLLFAALFVVPAWLAQVEDKGIQQIAVIESDANGQPVPDSLQFFRDVIPDKENMKFIYMNNMRLTDMLKTFEAGTYDGVLFLPQTLISTGNKAVVEFYYREPPGVGMESHIAQSIEDFLFNNKLIVKNISAAEIQALKTNISLNRIDWKIWPDKKEDVTDVNRGLGYVSGFLIYMFIFMFGAQVMRGVLEEKTSRIVEVVISSVRPFQLMMGKIIGIGLIGLTQFVAWMVLTFAIVTVAQMALTPKAEPVKMEQAAPADIMNNAATMSQIDPGMTQASGSEGVQVFNGLMKKLGQVNFALVIGAFLFYFLGGYVLYGSLFAAIGAAVDNETDTQQFMLPITIPLILGLFVMINSFLNPSGKLAVWFSIIPLTSPIVMMARIPFGVPPLQLLASAAALIATFLATTWLAAKIYRTGILMYGKKITYAELWKWIRYKG